MNFQIKEIGVLSLIALLITACVIGMILSIFLVSGHEEILSKMLNSTAEGKITGVAFTAGGPFSMWIISFLILRFALRKFPQEPIKLFLIFPDSEAQPPTKPQEFRSAKCWYSIYKNGDEVEKRDATIHTDQIGRDIYAPYIYVTLSSSIINPEYQIFITHNQEEWISDSYSPKKGSIELR